MFEELLAKINKLKCTLFGDDGKIRPEIMPEGSGGSVVVDFDELRLSNPILSLINRGGH